MVNLYLIQIESRSTSFRFMVHWWLPMADKVAEETHQPGWWVAVPASLPWSVANRNFLQNGGYWQWQPSAWFEVTQENLALSLELWSMFARFTTGANGGHPTGQKGYNSKTYRSITVYNSQQLSRTLPTRCIMCVYIHIHHMRTHLCMILCIGAILGNIASSQSTHFTWPCFFYRCAWLSDDGTFMLYTFLEPKGFDSVLWLHWCDVVPFGSFNSVKHVSVSLWCSLGLVCMSCCHMHILSTWLLVKFSHCVWTGSVCLPFISTV